MASAAKETDHLLPASVDNTQTNGDKEFPSFWHLLRHGVVLDNVGSTARDHLANERTYLAWIRTALALTGVGIGLLKWEGIGNMAGYLVLTAGFFVLVNSSFRYVHVMANLSQAKFEPNVRSLLAMVTVIMVLIVTMSILATNDEL